MRLFLALLLLLAAPRLLAHADRIEDRLLLHFATGVHPIEGGVWRDLTGRLPAAVQGAPVLTNVGPAQGLLLDGHRDWLLVAPSLEAARPGLPTNHFSASAWVLLHDTHRDGGVVGFVQDNGDYERGWVLGYNRRSFTLRLATDGLEPAKVRLTTLAGRTPIEPGRWHHVAATYDGTTMRLFVDGKPDGEARPPAGNILYPERGRYAVGAYVDDNELYPLEGALFETRVHARALSELEIADIAQRNAGLLAWRAPVNRELTFVVAPYLQFGTRDAMTVMAETTGPATMVVEYAEAQPLRQRAETREAVLIHELRLTGLKPFTRYFYRVTCTDAEGNQARSEVLTFQTAPGPQDAWSFGILGDTQRNPEVTRRCAEGLFGLRPNFLLHVGDVVNDGFAKQEWVFDFFAPCAPLLAHVPVFPVLGNHEKNSHWYYDYFSLPPPEYFYTFIYGNAEFFMVDSNKDCGPESAQYRRLEEALRRSKATWKFTVHHHPCFSSDEDDYGDQWRGRAPDGFTWGDSNVRRLVPLYEKHGVDIAFAGHIHSYERTWPLFRMAINQKQGVRYIISGGGGGGLEQPGPQRAWFTLHVARGHHYAFAAVQDRTIQFKAYDLEGRLFDTFELTKPPGR